MKNQNSKKNITCFLILVFLLPGICLFLSKNFYFFQQGPISFVLFGIRAMTPTLSAVIVIMLSGGRRELVLFIKKCYLKNLKLSYLSLAIILPLTVLVVAKTVAFFILKQNTFFTGIGITKAIVIMWALIAEEVGWRGFLQEKINESHGHFLTPIIVGLIWALWHYHLFLSGSMSTPIILFTLGCIAESFGYYWITLKSKGNVIPASIWHFTGNLFFNLFFINPERNNGSIVPYLLFVICTTVMALGISVWGSITTRKNIEKKQLYL